MGVCCDWKIRAIWSLCNQLYKQVFKGEFSNAYCYINGLFKYINNNNSPTKNNTPLELGLTAVRTTLELFIERKYCSRGPQTYMAQHPIPFSGKIFFQHLFPTLHRSLLLTSMLGGGVVGGRRGCGLFAFLDVVKGWNENGTLNYPTWLIKHSIIVGQRGSSLPPTAMWQWRLLLLISYMKG